MVIGEGEVEAVEDLDARADDALDRFLPPDDEGVVARIHHVTALVVAHEGAAWLPRTLEAVAGQERAPDVVVGIDAGSLDGSAGLLGAAIATVTQVGAGEGLARALAAGVVAAEEARTAHPAPATTAHPAPASPAHPASAPPPAVPQDAVHWYWIVHDDSAPQTGCLAALLKSSDRNPAAVVLVPKTVGWSDPARLVGIGHRWSPGTPVVDRLEPWERDQGQYDIERPVYAGDSAGMLIRADTWHALSGMDPTLGGWAGPTDLCRRAWGSGGDVAFVPAAVVAHRQAGHRGVRPATESHMSPRRRAREGQLLLELTQAPALTVPWRWFRGWILTVVRALALVLTREPEEATAELRGAWDALGHPRRLRAGRRAFRAPPVVDTSRPAHVRATRGAVIGHAVDGWLVAWRATGRGRVRLRLPPSSWQPLGVFAGLAVAAFLMHPGQILGSGTLQGGGLLPAPGAMTALTDYLASWHDVRFGTDAAPPAYLPLLAAASVPVLGSLDLLLRILFGLAVPLAFLSAYASIGPAVVGRQRLPFALAWALLPAGVAASGGGRLSTLALLLLGPPTARLLVRAWERARRRDSGIGPAITAGTMLGLTSAFAPLVLVGGVVLGVASWIVARRPRWAVRPGLVVLGSAVAFVILWAPRVVAAPWLLLSDLGRNDPSLGDPAPWVWGISPGGPSAVDWVGLPLLVVAGVAVLAIGPTPRRLAVLAGALGLMAVVSWTGPAVAVLWPEVEVASLWPGQPLLLAGGALALLVARATAHPGRRADVVSVAWVACVAVLGVGWWMAPSILSTANDAGLPPVVGLAEDSAERPRSLALERTASGVTYAVSTGPQARLGDADALAGRAEDSAFASIVQALVSGAGGDAEVSLGSRGIRFVVFNGPPEDPMVAELDAAVGLRRLASAAEQSLWQVAGEPVRAELVGAEGVPDVVVPVLTRPTSVDVVLHPQTALPRQLALAEAAAPGWRGELAGEQLDLVADERGMLSAPIAGTGPLQVQHRGPWTYLAVAQLLVMAALMIVALPKHRPVDPDTVDPDGLGLA
ncbi:MAG TPA: hypothetical protein VES03_08435 [Motilibacterales bacterium]|nr:hypothetical protein [Motilibacterales bacterium]